MTSVAVDDQSPLRVDLDRPVPQRAIRALAQIIADKFRPDKIILFGSYASGNPGPESDVDILVVMDTPDGPWPVMEAIWKALPRRSFGLDLLVRSQAEIDRRLADEDWFTQEIVGKGKILYEGRNGGMGAQGGK